jgi:hypothetical protein
MVKLKNTKPVKLKLVTKPKTQSKKIALAITDTHSQDADRHRRVKHPVSEK